MKRVEGNENGITKKCHVANVQGMIELENHHFTTTRVVIDSSKNHQWVLKSLVKGYWLDRCLLAQCSPYGLLGFLQKENNLFLMEGSGGYYINQMIQFSITGNIRKINIICLMMRCTVSSI